MSSEQEPGKSKERPILFSGEMVRAILDGRKTQTRRVMMPQPNPITGTPVRGKVYTSGWFEDGPAPDYVYKLCPYGQTGDRLWVRETWADCDPIRFRADLFRGLWKDNDQVWKPSIFMPRWASRITLEVLRVRVERVQDISEVDAKAEGVDLSCGPMVHSDYPNYKRTYHQLWDSINVKRGYPWASNPWVWVIEFRRLP